MRHHHHRDYNYERSGSEEGLRRDIRRRRYGIALMLIVGLAIIIGLVFLSVVK